MPKQFRPQRRNANKHTERGLKALEQSVQADGWIGALTVAADGETFDGSARLGVVDKVTPNVEPIVVESDGTRPVIVKRTDILSADDTKAKRLALAANRVAELDLNWDTEVMADLAKDADVVAGLFDRAELRDLIGANEPPADAEPQIDRAAELLESGKSRRVTCGASGSIGFCAGIARSARMSRG